MYFWHFWKCITTKTLSNILCKIVANEHWIWNFENMQKTKFLIHMVQSAKEIVIRCVSSSVINSLPYSFCLLIHFRSCDINLVCNGLLAWNPIPCNGASSIYTWKLKVNRSLKPKQKEFMGIDLLSQFHSFSYYLFEMPKSMKVLLVEIFSYFLPVFASKKVSQAWFVVCNKGSFFTNRVNGSISNCSGLFCTGN